MKTKFELELNLYGPQGNAFAVMGFWQAAAWDSGWTKEETDKVLNEGMTGNYAYLIQTINEWLVEPLEIPPGNNPPEKFAS